MHARITAAIAGVLLAVGLLIGFLPVHAAGVSCGSAFATSDELGQDSISAALGSLPDSNAMAACSDARSSRLVPAVVLLVVGAAGLVAAVMMSQRRPVGPRGPVPPVPPGWRTPPPGWNRPVR